MTDKEMEQRIKKAADAKPIKTTAKDILLAYEKKKQKKKVKPWYLRQGFLGTTISFALVGMVVGFGLSIFLDRGVTPGGSNSIQPTLSLPPSPPILAPKNNAILNQASYELLAGIEAAKGMGETIGVASKNVVLRPRQSDDSEDFSSVREAVKAFDTYRPMVFALEAASQSNSYYTPIESTDASFPFAISIDSDFILYYKDAFEETEEEETEQRISAKLVREKDKASFDIKIVKEVEREQDEVEIELTTTLYLSKNDTFTISHSKESEDGEEETVYSLIQTQNGEEVSKLEFNLEREDSTIEKTFSIEKAPGLSTSYHYEISNMKIESPSSFTLRIDETKVQFDGDVYYSNGTKIYP